MAENRAALELKNSGFGRVRESCLLTQGNNYFGMREYVVNLLGRLSKPGTFEFNREKTPDEILQQTGYSVTSLPAIDFYQNLLQKMGAVLIQTRIF